MNVLNQNLSEDQPKTEVTPKAVTDAADKQSKAVAAPGSANQNEGQGFTKSLKKSLKDGIHFKDIIRTFSFLIHYQNAIKKNGEDYV